jgi:hypothetical protein
MKDGEYCLSDVVGHFRRHPKYDIRCHRGFSRQNNGCKHHAERGRDIPTGFLEERRYVSGVLSRFIVGTVGDDEDAGTVNPAETFNDERTVFCVESSLCRFLRGFDFVLERFDLSTSFGVSARA